MSPKSRSFVVAAIVLNGVTPRLAFAADTSRTLPSELSALAMFMQADIVVKAVMVGLASACLAAFVVLLAKKIELMRLSAALRAGVGQLASEQTLAQAARTANIADRVCIALMKAASDEVARSGPRLDKEGVKERISIRFSRIEAAAAREATRGVGLLATIGATAPFVGLFGTVWGVMNSFIGISKAQTTNLAVVAPGIAEALLATAIGLVAAIPAVIFYNHLTKTVGAYRALVADAVASVSVLVGRDLDGAPAVRLAAE